MHYFWRGVQVNFTPVKSTNVVASINSSAEGLTINAGKLNLNGYVTATSLQSGGSTTIDGSRISTGSINADRLKANVISAINGSSGTLTIDAGKLNLTGYITATDIGNSGSTVISGNRITTGTIDADRIDVAKLTAQKLYSEKDGSSVDIQGGAVRIKNTDDEFFQITASDSDNRYLALGGRYCAAKNTINDVETYIGGTDDANRTIGIVKAGYDKLRGSDRRIKENIEDIPEDYAKELINNVKPVWYTYRKRPYDDKLHYGVIAQDVRNALDSIGEKVERCTIFGGAFKYYILCLPKFIILHIVFPKKLFFTNSIISLYDSSHQQSFLDNQILQ